MARPLPLLTSAHEKPAICGPCGGTCCKAAPGIASPEDFGAPDRATMRARIAAALESGRWAIDWWEADEDAPRTEYIRPAVKGREHETRHPSWGGRCTFLGAHGCELKVSDRPRNCRGLVPSRDGACGERHGDGTLVGKLDHAIGWASFQDVIRDAEDMVAIRKESA